jgi:hypothetical protein
MPKGKKELEVEFTCPLGSECEEIRIIKFTGVCGIQKLVAQTQIQVIQ